MTDKVLMTNTGVMILMGERPVVIPPTITLIENRTIQVAAVAANQAGGVGNALFLNVEREAIFDWYVADNKREDLIGTVQLPLQPLQVMLPPDKDSLMDFMESKKGYFTEESGVNDELYDKLLRRIRRVQNYFRQQAMGELQPATPAAMPEGMVGLSPTAVSRLSDQDADVALKDIEWLAGKLITKNKDEPFPQNEVEIESFTALAERCGPIDIDALRSGFNQMLGLSAAA